MEKDLSKITEINEKLKNFHEELMIVKESSCSEHSFEIEIIKTALNMSKYLVNQKDLGFLIFEPLKNNIEIDEGEMYKIVFTFKNLLIQVCVATGDEVLFRRGHFNESPIGRWFGDEYRSIDEARDELAILESWGSPLTGEYKVRLKKGTVYLKGIARNQSAKPPNTETRVGGGVQYYIQPHNILEIL